MTENRTTIDLSAMLLANKPKKHNSLGRGISALIADAKQHDSRNQFVEQHEATFKNLVLEINIDDCVPSRYQARKEFNLEGLTDLSNSIKEKGVLQPIVVRKLPSEKYEIVAGERRCRASKIAGLSTIPAVIMELDDKSVMEIGLIENLQRKDLNPIEEATAYKLLSLEFNYTHDDIATLVGKSRSYISNFLRVLTLPQEILTMITDGLLTMGHAKMLVNVANPIETAQKIIHDQLNVGETENLTKTMEDKHHKKKDMDTQARYTLEQNYQSMLNFINNKGYYSVKAKAITQSSGELRVKYSNPDALNHLLASLNVEDISKKI